MSLERRVERLEAQKHRPEPDLVFTPDERAWLDHVDELRQRLFPDLDGCLRGSSADVDMFGSCLFSVYVTALRRGQGLPVRPAPWETSSEHPGDCPAAWSGGCAAHELCKTFHGGENPRGKSRG